MRFLPFVASMTLAWTGTAAAQTYGAAPWQTYRDANPFASATGLPYALPAVAPRGWSFEAGLDASNTEMLQQSVSGESLLYDMEIQQQRLSVAYGFGDHWLARVTFARQRFSEGALDSLVEDFHDAFGFSPGDRDRLGSDGHTIRYQSPRGDGFTIDRSFSGTAPLSIDLAYREPGERSEWLYGATLKVPMSHESPLLDDRSHDVSLWLAHQTTDVRTWPWGWRVGVMQRGDGDLLPDRQKDHAVFAEAVLGWHYADHWDVTVQPQWHSELYRSDLALLQSAGTLLLSSGWSGANGWRVRAGLVEDVPRLHAQDVTVFLTVGWSPVVR